MLLHGIDRQLAQALTIPASARLCKLRAAIAVTSGYLRFPRDLYRPGHAVHPGHQPRCHRPAACANFVGRYLNAGRLPDLLDTGSGPGDPPAIVPNACLTCPDLRPCHDTFGASGDRYGFYPFNGAAIDRLVDLASPGDFQPREVLRQVIRAPLEVAEEELPSGGFPSAQFARALDDVRKPVPPAVRATIRRLNPSDPEAEMSLRAFYALSPPAEDPALARIASYLGARLTPGVTDDQEPPDDDPVQAIRPGKPPAR